MGLIYNSAYLLRLTRRLEAVSCPDLVFAHFNDVSADFADAFVVKPDACRPPVVIEIPFVFRNSNPTPNYEYLL
jgi:hypothetical protein